MKINQHTTLAEIQSAFSSQFPYLRIEFYKKAHRAGEGTADREKLSHDKTLSEISKSVSAGELTFSPELQINQFEGLMENSYGLHVQVFRRSGNLWLQTTITDDWTLQKANQKGRHSEEMSKEQPQEEPEPPGPETE